jgi:hypothetical protein
LIAEDVDLRLAQGVAAGRPNEVDPQPLMNAVLLGAHAAVSVGPASLIVAAGEAAGIASRITATSKASVVGL